MRIYTQVVMEIATGAVVSASYHEYAGPVALCKGTDTTINSTDPEYNAGMLEISRDEWGLAEKYANLFEFGVTYDPNESEYGDWVDGEWVTEENLEGYSQEHYIENPDWTAWKQRFDNAQRQALAEGDDPYFDEAEYRKNNPEPLEQILNRSLLQERKKGDVYGYDPAAQVSEMDLILQRQAGEAELLPLQTELARTQMDADLALVPAQTNLSLAQIQAEQTLLPKRTGVEAAALDDQAAFIEARAPVRAAFFESALDAPDPNKRADEAQAGVEHAFGNTRQGFERALFTNGVGVGDADMTKALNERSIAKATGISAARTTARRTAEDEAFAKLTAASALGYN